MNVEFEVEVSTKNCDRIAVYNGALEDMLSKKGSVVCGLSRERGGRGLVWGTHAYLRVDDASVSTVPQWWVGLNVIGECALVTS